MSSLVTCKKCGWVHYCVSRKHAENEVQRFNEYFSKLTEDKQKEYYGGKGSDISNYEHCMVCGSSYKDFKDFKEGDCPRGCTINPIIDRKD